MRSERQKSYSEESQSLSLAEFLITLLTFWAWGLGLQPCWTTPVDRTWIGLLFTEVK